MVPELYNVSTFFFSLFHCLDNVVFSTRYLFHIVCDYKQIGFMLEDWNKIQWLWWAHEGCFILCSEIKNNCGVQAMGNIFVAPKVLALNCTWNFNKCALISFVNFSQKLTGWSYAEHFKLNVTCDLSIENRMFRSLSPLSVHTLHS